MYWGVSMEAEAVLIEQACSGDIKAFNEIVSSYGGRIYSYCLRMTNNKEDAEDLTQEVFIKVYKSISRFNNKCKFSTWVYRIAYNTCIDRYRKKKFKTVGLSEVAQPSDDADKFNPELNALQSEKARLIKECLANMKVQYRNIIILRDIQDHSYEEIASILKLPLGTVKSQISRARRALKKNLDARMREVE